MRDVNTQLRFFIAVILLGILGAFTLQNTSEVELSFLHWTFHSRRIVVIGLSLVVGLVVGWLFGFRAGRRN